MKIGVKVMPRKEVLDTQRRIVNRPLCGKQAEFESCVHFKILHVQPACRPGTRGDKDGQGRSEESWLHRKHHLRLPERLAQHDWNASQHERDQMRNPFQASGPLGHKERDAIHDRLPGHSLGAIPRAAIILTNTPRRIVGWRRNHADLVPALFQPGRHLAGIFSNSRQFGSIVETIDQYSQTCLSNGCNAAACVQP